MQAGYVFAEDVKLKIDHCSHLNVSEVGVLTRVGDDGYLECVVGGIADGKGYAVYGYRSFVYGEVSAPCHVGGKLVFKLEVGASVGITHVYAAGGLVYMSLNDVPVQPTVLSWM